MRIDRLDLIRFGHFAGRDIAFPEKSPDFYLLYGNNEAGKSTLLRAISALFFGVPAKTPDTHSCKGSELRVGATVSSPGNVFSFRRRKGTTTTLLSTDESQLQENALASFLPELDQERFEQFFALNHDRLREGGEELLRGKGDIGSALFQAAGLLELRKLLEGLDKEARELFSPKSRGKEIGAALEEYKKAKSETRQLAIPWTKVKDTRAELQATQENLHRLKKDSEALQAELIRLRRIAGNKPDVARLQELRSKLVALESVPVLPAGARVQRNEAITTLASAVEQVDKLSRQIAQRKERIASLPLSTIFKSHARQIEDLNSRTRDYTHSVTDLPKRARTLDEEMGLAEAAWKQIWPQCPVSDAELARNAYFLQKAEIRRLITEQALLSVDLEKARQHLQQGLEEQQRLSREIDASTEPPDPATLFALIDQGKSLGDVDQIAAGLQKEIERVQGAATLELRTLRLFKGTAEELASLETPLLTTVDRYAHEIDGLNNRRNDARTSLGNARKAIREKEAEVKTLQARVGNAAETDLAEARRRRDDMWHSIRTSVLESKPARTKTAKPSTFSAELTETFTGEIQRADSIADFRFLNAKDAAVHDRLVKEIEALRIQERRLEDEASRLEQEEQDLSGRWKGEWRCLKAEPLSPAEMREWMQLREAILERLQQCREKEEELRLVETRSKQAAAQLIAQLKTLGKKSGTENDQLAVAIRVAEKFAREIEEHRRLRADLSRGLQLLAVPARQAHVKDCERKLAEWSQKWTPLLRSLLLPETSTPEQVGDALDVLETVFSQLGKAEKSRRQVTTIGEDIANFKKQVSQLIAVVDPSLAPLPPEQAVAELHSKYIAVGQAETKRKTLEDENAADELTIAAWSAKQETAEAALQKLRDMAQCESDQQLEIAIAASEDKTAKQTDYERIAAGLRERNGVPNVTHIEEEAAEYELDSLQAQIKLNESRRQELDNELIAASSAQTTVRQEYERLEASTESSLRAQQAEDALGKLRPAISQYLRLRLASETLQRAIESYREKHQAPVLKRASEIFSALTLREYSALDMAFSDDDKQILVAVRKNGEKIEVEGLSDGTRDQLYLALRLAFIEHHVETVAPCPVILDDILINFDDARSLATLQVLKELACRTQVLFFTHHRRLAELGSQAGAEIVEFGAVAAAAIA